MQKNNIIIIAKCNDTADLNLYKLLYSKEHELHKRAVVYLVSDVEQFDNLLFNSKDDFRFSLLVHLGATGESTKYDGQLIIEHLKQLPYYSNLKYELTSRKGKYVEGFGDVIYTLDLVHPTFDPAVLKENILAEVLNVTTDKPGDSSIKTKGLGAISKGIDFAILTALYEDEFQIYKEHCITQSDSILGNCFHSKFVRKIDRVKDDYEKKFALIHQEQMGLVDAAIYSTQIVDKIDPKFLLMGGVCGGLKGSVELYDIIIPTVVYDYATGKMKGEDKEAKEPIIDLDKKLEITYEGDKKEISGKLEPKNYKADSERLLTSFLERKKPEIIQNMKELMPETEKKNFPANFNIHINEFACGPWVVKTDGFLDDYLLEEFSKQIKGLEMESYSINRVGNIAQKYGRFSLVVKSVMDFTDPKKKDGPDGRIKKFAALMSFVCIRAMMPILLEYNDPKLSSE